MCFAYHLSIKLPLTSKIIYFNTNGKVLYNNVICKKKLFVEDGVRRVVELYLVYRSDPKFSDR